MDRNVSGAAHLSAGLRFGMDTREREIGNNTAMDWERRTAWSGKNYSNR